MRETVGLPIKAKPHSRRSLYFRKKAPEGAVLHLFHIPLILYSRKQILSICNINNLPVKNMTLFNNKTIKPSFENPSEIKISENFSELQKSS